MVNLTSYPYPTYESNVPAAAVVASLIGISLIAWIVQSVQSRFKPRRINILLLIGHLTLFVELILRASLSTDVRNSRAAFTATTVLLAVGLRMIILANYDYIVQVGDVKTWISRTIVIGTMICAIVSALLMAPAGTASYDRSTIPQSFRLRQASAALVLCMVVLFYPIWFAIKTFKKMTKFGLILIIISSIACLIVAIYLVITSSPDYYVATSAQEYWFYIFQFTPMAIALFTWTILHPKRSLPSTESSNGKVEPSVDTKT